MQNSSTTIRRFGRVVVVLAGAGALAAGALGASGASAGSASHTLKMSSLQIKDVMVNGVDVAADRDVQGGKTTGFDATSCLINPKTFTATCDVALARADGMLYGHAVINVQTGKGSGTVTGGTRAYKGSTGTISVAPGPNPNSPQITIVYRG
jgi:hypothetical protein